MQKKLEDIRKDLIYAIGINDHTLLGFAINKLDTVIYDLSNSSNDIQNIIGMTDSEIIKYLEHDRGLVIDLL